MAVLDILPFAHHLTRRALRAGDVAVDATAGNGHDTVHLAETVGESGTVFAFDVQDRAIQTTRHKVTTRVPAVDVRLLQEDHAAMLSYIPEEMHGTVGAVMFNLGYLPRGDHDQITTPETTLPALEAACNILRPGGLVTVVLYTGHRGGEKEAAAVCTWAEGLPQDPFAALSYRFVNRVNAPPRLLAIQKTGGG